VIGELTPLGLQASFLDVFGVERTVSDATLARLREQLDDAPRPAPHTVPLVGSPDWGHGELVGELICKDGQVWQLDGWLPPEVPYGYHRLSGPNAIDRLVVVVPPTFAQPPRGFGLAVQLYAARSPQSWGIGDFSDLGWLARPAAAAPYWFHRCTPPGRHATRTRRRTRRPPGCS
jgi:4-alpha-glucanotransferase